MKNHLLLSLLTTGVLLAAPVAMADGETLFKSKPCVACHAVEKKLVGPALKDVAEKYAGEDAVASVAGHIKNGSSGIWGPIPMPANQVSEEEATLLAEWILGLN